MKSNWRGFKILLDALRLKSVSPLAGPDGARASALAYNDEFKNTPKITAPETLMSIFQRTQLTVCGHDASNRPDFPNVL
jgi:hypothetical protein